MPIVEMTREQIVRAIKAEPLRTLRAGNFVWWNTTKNTVRSRDCYVCAVGAVLRRALHPSERACEIARAAEAETFDNDITEAASAERLAARGHYMNALSCVFEGAYSEAINTHDDDKKAITIARKTALAFVEKHFPAKVRIDIDGAKPAKDVKVVRTWGRR